MGGIEIRGLTKVFRDQSRALDAVDLDVASGELMVLVGPSGSGKTTLLRLIAGLDQPTAGTIRLGGNDLAGVPPHKRNVALVFQNLALYGHLNVAQNLEFGLNHQKSGGGKVVEVASLVGIDHLLDRLPAELSGGEQQRVALGRAIVRQPNALLLDEPLSSLDGPKRRELRRELKSVQRRLGAPTIYVTHDQAEALSLGDRIAVLDRGQLQQVGTPNDIYHRPANRFVAEFFGPQGMNVLRGKLIPSGDTTSFRADGWEIAVPNVVAKLSDKASTRDILCGFRPENLVPGIGELVGHVTDAETIGDAIYIHVRVQTFKDESQVVIARRHVDLRTPAIGACIQLTLDTNHLHWFDPATGHRL